MKQAFKMLKQIIVMYDNESILKQRMLKESKEQQSAKYATSGTKHIIKLGVVVRFVTFLKREIELLEP